MTIDHIAVYTSDIERLSNFYENYFYAILSDYSEDKKTGILKRYLKFDGGVKLELVTFPDLANDTAKRPHTGYGYVCISAGSRKSVDSVTARVFRDGYHVMGIPKVADDGLYKSCIEDPDGNLIEITE